MYKRQGYSNVRKSSFTGSSTQITGDELRKVSQTNILGAIQSFDPSFRLVDNTQFGSDPNTVPEMYIRGRSGFGIKDLDKDLSRSNLENNPNLPTFITVSYTHLDVYKRQSLISAGFIE